MTAIQKFCTIWQTVQRNIISVSVALCVALTQLAGPAAAQNIPLIRDSEIEDLLSKYAKPIFKAAGIGSGRVSMRIVRSPGFNAFVIDGRNVFVNTGALMQANTPNEIIGVIAHEAGHISGGHLAALRARIRKDQTRALLAQILGIGLLVAGGATGGDTGRDIGAAGQGALYGGTAIITKALLAERRSQESAADQAGLGFLNKTKQSGLGMLATFERFAQQEYISDAYKDAFVRSHPVATARLARLRRNVENSPFFGIKDPPERQLRHDLMRGKLSGYLESPAAVFNRYTRENKTLPARYARAIATFFRGGPNGLQSALAQTDALIATKPNYAYFWELKGDFLMRSGRQREAVGPLKKALKLAGDAPLIRVQLAQALQGSKSQNDIAQSVKLLKKSLESDKNPQAYRLLANAYYKQGRRPRADAMIAQAHFLSGRLKDAKLFAKRAQSKLKAGSPEWLNNDDIINFKTPKN